MKKITLLSMVLLPLAACSSIQHKDDSKLKVGMANPASEFCIQQKGKLNIKNEANGQVGYCTLPNGQVVEEWEFFHSQQKICAPDEARKLIGQAGLTNDQIKKVTKAELIRNIAPGQPVTMDYRENRITITTDPVSKKIIDASCG